MIFELEKTSFTKIKKISYEGIQYPEVQSIIDLNNPGWIFVDNLNNPQTSLVWNKGIGGFYLLGNPENEIFINELSDYIDCVIAPRAKMQGLNSFEVSATTEEWNQQIEKIFQKRNLFNWEQQTHIWNFSNALPICEEIDNIKYFEINTTLLNDENIVNMTFLYDKITSFWGDINSFFEKGGYGHCAVKDNKIASVCFTGFIAGDIHCIDIETFIEFRCKGIGYSLACKLIKSLVDDCKKPYWDCTKSNISSMQLARKLGFCKTCEYVCYGFDL